jgi:hypothetical protein
MADRELERLSLYMVHIATVQDFRTLSHKVSHSPLVRYLSTCKHCVRIGRLLREVYAGSEKGYVPDRRTTPVSRPKTSNLTRGLRRRTRKAPP